MLLDEALRTLLRDEMRTVVREELRSALDEFRTSSPSSASGEFLSVKQAAALAGVCPSTVRGWIRQGHLKRYGTARLPRLRRVELVTFLAHPVPSDVPTASIHEQAEAILSRLRLP